MNSKSKFRTTVLYRDFFQDFFLEQPDKVKASIIWTLELVEDLERIPDTYLKSIKNSDGLYEIRVQSGRKILRFFCFFDKDKLFVLNGFHKKTRKTPRKEIEKALKIKKEYERSR
jgi:phage-related protein